MTTPPDDRRDRIRAAGTGRPPRPDSLDPVRLRLNSIPGAGGALSTLLAASEQMLHREDAPNLNAAAARLHESLLQRLDVDRLDGVEEAEARRLVQEAAAALIASGVISIGDIPLYGEAREQLLTMVTDEVLGFGPIQSLLDAPDVSEVMVNAPDHIYYEREGVIRLSGLHFRDESHVRRVADRILSVIGRRVDEASPMVDARLRDGSRVNITIPPASPRSTTITIRKFRADRHSMADLIAAGSLDNRMQAFLAVCTEYGRNILISGGTGSGKTTMLNAISAFIPRSARIVTIEDPVELSLLQDHVIPLEARPPDLTGQHAITQRDLLRNALRMRPDRIIVGEIRGAEAFEMLQAMNTGHDGSLSTVHANTPRDAVARVENMVLMAGFDLPVAAIREQIASAIHLIVQLQRSADGVRRVVKITEVTGLEGQQLTLQDLYTFEARGRDAHGRLLGAFRPTGLRPTFADDLLALGGTLDAALFLEDRPFLRAVG